MSIAVNLYTFAKKVNSTGRPSSSPVSFDCVLKDDCSIINPVIGIDSGAAWNPSAYNYAKITSFGRYYYINDWSYAEGLWWAALTVDPLASWKDEILSDSAYILRSTDHWSGAIIDGLYPATSLYSVKRNTWENGTPWKNQLTQGFYTVGVINSDSSSMGAVSYYAFTPTQFSTLKSFLLSDVTWTGILQTNPDLGENLYKSLFDPFQYITSVLWFPFDLPTANCTLLSTIKIGWWEIPQVPCYRINEYRHQITANLKAYAHPLYTERGAFLNGSPYSRYRLIAPPFGEFDLDASLFAPAYFNDDAPLPENHYTPVLTVIEIDLLTGYSVLNLNLTSTGASAAGVSLLLNQTMLAIPIQLAQIYSRVTTDTVMNTLEQSASTIIKGLIGAATGGGEPNKGGRFTAEGILDALAAGDNHMSQMGSNGSLAQFNIFFELDSFHFDLVEDNWVENGRPVCEYRNLIDFADEFVLTEKADVVIPATEQEINAVNDALNRGIYLT